MKIKALMFVEHSECKTVFNTMHISIKYAGLYKSLNFEHRHNE